jgi:uncharacterized protein
MKCPSCNIEMRLSEREGIETLYCTQCGGVWLERGDLEGIVARIAEAAPNPQSYGRAGGRNDEDRDDERSSIWGGRRGRDSDDQSERRGGLGGILGNLFNLD